MMTMRPSSSHAGAFLFAVRLRQRAAVLYRLLTKEWSCCAAVKDHSDKSQCCRHYTWWEFIALADLYESSNESH